VLLTPATRHDALPDAQSGFTGYLVKPLRASSLATQLTNDATMPSPPIATAEPASIESPERSLHVLIAEDNEINALLTQAMVRRLGHRTVMAVNGEAAVQSLIAAEAAGAPFDLVLMDVQMPVLDGIAATRLIRFRETDLRVPILALTANTRGEDRDACFTAGMDEVLVKPLDRDRLDDALRRVTSQRAAVIPLLPDLHIAVGNP
jgi:CheY-like chemotaxis protein